MNATAFNWQRFIDRHMGSDHARRDWQAVEDLLLNEDESLCLLGMGSVLDEPSAWAPASEGTTHRTAFRFDVDGKPARIVVAEYDDDPPMRCVRVEVRRA